MKTVRCDRAGRSRQSMWIEYWCPMPCDPKQGMKQIFFSFFGTRIRLSHSRDMKTKEADLIKNLSLPREKRVPVQEI